MVKTNKIFLEATTDGVRYISIPCLFCIYNFWKYSGEMVVWYGECKKSRQGNSKAYSEWKSNQDTQPFNENVEKEYQTLLETLSPEQEEVLTKYCDEIFASGAETEEFFYRLGIKDGLRLKSTVKSVLEMMSWNRDCRRKKK